MYGKKANRILARFGDKNSLLFPGIGLVVIFLVIHVISLVLEIYVLIVLSFSATGGLLILLIKGRSIYNQELRSELEKVIYQHLKKCGLNRFNLEKAIGEFDVPYEQLRNACFEIYKKFAWEALKDFRINENERKVLFSLRDKLGISIEVAEKLEENVKGEKYDRELNVRLSDGVLTKKETDELRKLRTILGLKDATLREATRKSAVEGYRRLFSRFATNGLINAEELEELRDLASSTGMTPAEASNISYKEALNLYRRTIAMVCQDGIITDEEKKLVDVLGDLLRLPSDLVAPLREQFNEMQKLEQIRKGKLPQIKNHRLNLKSTELCHWISPCLYNYETKTRVIELKGNLIVTSRRIIFSSSQRGIEYSIKKILNIQSKSNALRLKLTSSRGQGTYYVDGAKKLSAILEALVRRRNYFIAERLDNAKSRHIPDEVKIAVWHRDAGKCVRCGKTDYLEFDHVIPFSRGGANSENNIQLLCRRCNLSKGGELV